SPGFLASSFFGWMQSTGQASTHAISLVPIHGSAITYVINSVFSHFDCEGNFWKPNPALYLAGRHAANLNREWRFLPAEFAFNRFHSIGFILRNSPSTPPAVAAPVRTPQCTQPRR